MSKHDSESAKIEESKQLKKIVMKEHKLVRHTITAEKLDKMLYKSLNEVYQAFGNMDQNIYQVKMKAGELADQKLEECADQIEQQQQTIKNIMTSSFQQMKEFVSSIKACHDEEQQSREIEPSTENDIIVEAREETSKNSERLQTTEKPEEDKDSDSEDTIFYDACDAMILDEIQKVSQRESLLDKPYVETEDIRTTLPALKPDGKFSLLKILKDAIGKDLSKF